MVHIAWGLGSLVLAVAFYFRWSWVQDFWPWSGGSYYGNAGDLSRLSFYFVSSVFAAIALPNLWLGLSGELAAITGGAINLGASAYFALGVLVPKWSNAIGQLIGFLAYDVVLILPFLEHFDVARGIQHTNLIIYTVVVVSSALLAIFYLFMYPPTRLWRTRQMAALAA